MPLVLVGLPYGPRRSLEQDLCFPPSPLPSLIPTKKDARKRLHRFMDLGNTCTRDRNTFMYTLSLHALDFI